MTLEEIKTLKVDDKIGYQTFHAELIVAATVKEYGPQLAAEESAFPYMRDLLVVAIDGTNRTQTWELANFPDGIPQLFPVSEINTRPGFRG